MSKWNTVLTHTARYSLAFMVSDHFLQVALLLFSHWVLSDSLQPQGLQHARLPCPSPFPRVCSNSSYLLCLLLGIMPLLRVSYSGRALWRKQHLRGPWEQERAGIADNGREWSVGFTYGQQDLGVEVGCGVPGSGKWHGEMKLAYPQLWRKTWWPGGALEGRGQLWGGGSRGGVPCARARFWSVAWRQAWC